LTSDWRGEFSSKEFNELYANHGIHCPFEILRPVKLNGVAEKKNQTILSSIPKRCMRSFGLKQLLVRSICPISLLHQMSKDV
jgi:hypothetical protein